MERAICLDPLLERETVERLTTLSKSEIYRRIAAGSFPRQVPIGRRRVAWRQSEIAAWIAARG